MLLTAQSIGYLAFETLATSPEAVVIGATTQGLFLRATGRWLTFISFGPYRSPLTLTLATVPAELRAIEPQTGLTLQANRLYFPTGRLVVGFDPVAVWSPAPPGGVVGPRAERLERLQYFIAATKPVAGKRGFGQFLEPLLALAAAGPVVDPILADMRQLRRALRQGQLEPALAAVSRLLGLGSGLTASGDDFVIGLLLLLQRWPQPQLLAGQGQRFSEAVVAAAYRSSTRLSANLIECAARGQADERLLNLADCLVTGNPDPAGCLAPLLSWGASSGVDTLAGMAVALDLLAPDERWA